MSRILASFCGRQQTTQMLKKGYYILYYRIKNFFLLDSRPCYLILFVMYQEQSSWHSFEAKWFFPKSYIYSFQKEIVPGCCIIRTGEIMHNPEITIWNKKLELYSTPIHVSVLFMLYFCVVVLHYYTIIILADSCLYSWLTPANNLTKLLQNFIIFPKAKFHIIYSGDKNRQNTESLNCYRNYS